MNEQTEYSYKETINERTFKIVLLTSYLPTFAAHGDMMIAKNKYDLLVKYFGLEADYLKLSMDGESYMRSWVYNLTGMSYVIKQLACKADASAGIQECITLKAISKERAKPLKKNYYYLINIRMLDIYGKLRKRTEMIEAYNTLMDELKHALGARTLRTVIDIHKFEQLMENKNINETVAKMGSDYLFYIGKIFGLHDEDASIICINEDGIKPLNSYTFDISNIVRDLQNKGILL